MKIQRTIPPTAAPVCLQDYFHSLLGLFFRGLYIKDMEDEIKKYFGVKYVFLVSSGKAAFFLILTGLRSISPKKQKVVIPAYTCFSVPSAIVKAGLKISICDLESSTLDLDPNLLRETVDGDTLCVVPSHLFGAPSNVDRIKKICEKRGIFIVEDAAQAMGGEYKGKPFGTIGDVGFFSLGRGKNITCGSGGIIVTNSEVVAEAIKREYADIMVPGFMRNLIEFFKIMCLGIFNRPSLYWFPSVLSFLQLGKTIFDKDFPVERLPAMKAGFLKTWRMKLEDINKVRTRNASYFIKRLRLKTKADSTISYLRLPILVKDRATKNKLYSLSVSRGLGISPMYPTPINEIQEIHVHFNGVEFPSAAQIVERLLTLPTHQFLTERDRKSICESYESVVHEKYITERD